MARNAELNEVDGVEVLEAKVNITRITKNYQLAVALDSVTYKKLKIFNPEDYVKTLKIVSSDSSILIVRSPLLTLKENSWGFIKFKVKVSQDSEVFLAVFQHPSGMAEETLGIKLKVEDRPVTPTRVQSGTLKKNKSWNFTPRRPSPKRNSIDDS